MNRKNFFFRSWGRESKIQFDDLIIFCSKYLFFRHYIISILYSLYIWIFVLSAVNFELLFENNWNVEFGTWLTFMVFILASSYRGQPSVTTCLQFFSGGGGVGGWFLISNRPPTLTPCIAWWSTLLEQYHINWKTVPLSLSASSFVVPVLQSGSRWRQVSGIGRYSWSTVPTTQFSKCGQQ